MTPALEKHLRDHVALGLWPRDVIDGMLATGMIANAKQAWRTLEKWASRGEYEYGVSLDLGWLTETQTAHR